MQARGGFLVVQLDGTAIHKCRGGCGGQAVMLAAQRARKKTAMSQAWPLPLDRAVRQQAVWG